MIVCMYDEKKDDILLYNMMITNNIMEEKMNQSRAKKERSTEVQRALLGRFVQIFPSKIDARARSISIPIIPT